MKSEWIGDAGFQTPAPLPGGTPTRNAAIPFAVTLCLMGLDQVSTPPLFLQPELTLLR